MIDIKFDEYVESIWVDKEDLCDVATIIIEDKNSNILSLNLTKDEFNNLTEILIEAQKEFSFVTTH